MNHPACFVLFALALALGLAGCLSPDPVSAPENSIPELPIPDTAPTNPAQALAGCWKRQDPEARRDLHLQLPVNTGNSVTYTDRKSTGGESYPFCVSTSTERRRFTSWKIEGDSLRLAGGTGTSTSGNWIAAKTCELEMLTTTSVDVSDVSLFVTLRSDTLITRTETPWPRWWDSTATAEIVWIRCPDSET